MSFSRGVTLIELMVGLSIMAIALALGMPNFNGAFNSSRLTSTTNELVGGVQLARAEAIRRNRNVVLCRANAALNACALGGTWYGWLIFVDSNGNDAADAGEELVRTGTVEGGLVVMASSNIVARGDLLTFLPNGLARGNTENTLLNAALSICAASERPQLNVRDLFIGSGGRTSVRSRNSAAVCGTAPSNT